jgi:AcrR family transcriptional regulator
MMEQERLLGRTGTPQTGQGVVPEQRGPAEPPVYQGVSYVAVPYVAVHQDLPHQGHQGHQGQYGPYGLPPQATAPEGGLRTGGDGPGSRPGPRSAGARLRVDARRNLESVLRAAREVFGEFGYDAPMEEVARRAGVGVGTVYRRFPSKEVLVQRIASEEVAWLTAQAREALYGGAGPWEALAGYLARAVSTGAGRLLPPEAFRYAEDLGRVPGQRGTEPWAEGPWAGRTRTGDPSPGGLPGAADTDPRLLLQLIAALVARAGAAGELRPGVTVSDVVLVLTASVPVHAAAPSDESTGDGRVTDGRTADGRTTDGRATEGQPGSGPAGRLLQILLEGLRAR